MIQINDLIVFKFSFRFGMIRNLIFHKFFTNLGFLVVLSYKPLSYKKNKRVGIPRSSLASPSVKSDGVS